MRQEARFLLAITLMILVLVATNILFPPIPPEEVSGPEGEVPGQLEGGGVAGAPSIPLGGADTRGGVAGDEANPFAGQPGAAPSPILGPRRSPTAPLRIRSWSKAPSTGSRGVRLGLA